MKSKVFYISLMVIILAASALTLACSTSSPTPATSAATTTTSQAPAVTTTVSQPPVVTTTKPPVVSTTPVPSTSTPAKAINLKFSYHTPPKAGLVGDFFIPWTKDLENDSNGKLGITHYGGASLVSLENQYQAVISRLADMAMVETDVTPGVFPLSEIGLLPFIFPNAEIGARVYHELLIKYSINTELKDVKVLVTPTLTPAQYYGNKEVKTLADLKGVKFRVGGKVEGWITEALGATPVELSTSDLYSALQRKTVDAAWFNTAGVLGFALQEVTKYRTMVDLFPRAWVVVMNRQVWDSLPADVKAAFDKSCTPEISSKYSANYEKSAAGARKAIEGYDTKAGNPAFYALPADEKAKWVAAVKPVWERWVKDVEAKGLPGKAMLDDAIALVAKYSPK